MADDPNESCKHLLHGQKFDFEYHNKRWHHPKRSYCTLVGAILLIFSVFGNMIMLALWDHAHISNDTFHLYCMSIP